MVIELYKRTYVSMLIQPNQTIAINHLQHLIKNIFQHFIYLQLLSFKQGNNNRVIPTHPTTHPVLVGRSPDAVEVIEQNQPNEQGESSSSDSGVSDNTVRTEESTIVTGGDGCRFSKNSQEREDMLSTRKDELLRKARR